MVGRQLIGHDKQHQFKQDFGAKIEDEKGDARILSQAYDSSQLALKKLTEYLEYNT